MRIVSILTEIDCLISLAVTSGASDGVMSRPEFVRYEGEYEERALFDIKDMRHPCVVMAPGK